MRSHKIRGLIQDSYFFDTHYYIGKIEKKFLSFFLLTSSMQRVYSEELLTTTGTSHKDFFYSPRAYYPVIAEKVNTDDWKDSQFLKQSLFPIPRTINSMGYRKKCLFQKLRITTLESDFPINFDFFCNHKKVLCLKCERGGGEVRKSQDLYTWCLCL